MHETCTLHARNRASKSARGAGIVNQIPAVYARSMHEDAAGASIIAEMRSCAKWERFARFLPTGAPLRTPGGTHTQKSAMWKTYNRKR